MQTRRTQAERRSSSEQALLKAAIDIIAIEGVGGLTFEALGRAGGFSRGLAGLRFGSKARLIEAVMRHLHERQETLVVRHGYDRLAGLDAIITYVDDCLQDIARRNEARAYFMLLSSTVAEASEMRRVFAEIHREVEARISGWVTKGQAEGNIRPTVLPAAAAFTIGSLMFGINMQILVDAAIDFEAMRDTSLAMLQTAMENRPHDLTGQVDV
jgi:AcrR family transcriptional regulator